MPLLFRQQVKKIATPCRPLAMVNIKAKASVSENKRNPVIQVIPRSKVRKSNLLREILYIKINIQLPISIDLKISFD